jgi:hypothetical protein
LEKGAPAVQKPEPEAEEGDAEGATKKPSGAQATSKRSVPPTTVTLPEMDSDLFVQTCLSDLWIKEWLPSRPPLAREDLRPYFYFSRDKLGSLGGAAQRMSPVAQQVLAELFSESEAIRLRAVKKAPDLNTEDATAVFSSLADRARGEDDPGAENSALNHLFDWTRGRMELFAQLIAFLNDLPHTRFTPSVVPRLRGLAVEETQKKLATGLVQKWSESTTNSNLRRAAKAALNPKSR